MGAQLLANAQFDFHIYNDLNPDVKIAYDDLVATGIFEVFTEEAAELICSYGVQSSIGICLLHNHNYLDDDEIMLEYTSHLNDGRPSLVMQRTKTNKEFLKLPVNWKVVVDDDGYTYMPIEFSTVDGVTEANNLLEDNPELLREFAALVIRYGLSNLVGLAVYRHDFLRQQENDVFIETTDPKIIANVIAACPKETTDLTMVTPTLWRFQTNPDEEKPQGCVCGCRYEVLCNTADDPHRPRTQHGGIHGHVTEV